MRELTFDDIKKVALDILKDFDKVCKANELTYSIGYGTLLGAVRHKGFIPWDDDIDIVMPRDDFEKFITIRNQLDERNKFISVDTDANFTAPLAKIYDATTLLRETNHNDHADLGVYIDIIVFDYVPDNKIDRKLLYSRAYAAEKMWGLATYLPKTKLLSERIARKTALKVNLGRKASLAMNAYDRKLKKTSNMCNLQYSIYGFTKDTFPTSKINDVVPTEFEGSMFLGFKDYDYFLKQWYGDYMKLPPKEKQVTHHTYTVFYKD